MTSPLGLLLGSAIPPEQIRESARLGEELGFGELWLAEDYFFTGGIAGAVAALQVTDSIKVGTGVVSTMVRHPALLAMEISTIARMYPGRFMPGVGLGVPAWLDQMGVKPKSQLRALREGLTATRRLLAGETLTIDGEFFTFDQVALTYPLDDVPDLYLGVTGPKMLTLSGEIADGTVTSVFASVPYLRWARQRLAEGQALAGRAGHHRVPCFAMFSCDEDSDKARDALRPFFSFYMSHVPKTAMFDVYGIADDVAALAAQGPEAISKGMKPQWLSDLAVVGDPDECAAQVQALLDAGADSVVLFPQPFERSEHVVRLAAEHILPRVTRPDRIKV